jgi:hypothetical protein
MCSALVLTTDARIVVVTAMDGDFTVGEYASCDEEWTDPRRHWQSSPLPLDDDDQIDEARIGELVTMCATVAVGLIQSADPREEHQSAAGAACLDGGDGACVLCGVEMTTCNVCGGIGYHRENCRLSEDASS